MDQSYIQLMSERPELFANDESDFTIKIISDINVIREFEINNNITIGIVYQDQYVIFIKDLVTHPNGKIGPYIRLLPTTKASGVVILPILNDSFIFVKHFRHSTRSFHYELPRGFGSDSVSIEENVSKELFEETGYSIRELQFLGHVFPDTGLLSSHACVYAAFVDSDEQSPSDKEEAVSSVELINKKTVLQMVADGIITDGYSLSALAYYWANE